MDYSSFASSGRVKKRVDPSLSVYLPSMALYPPAQAPKKRLEPTPLHLPQRKNNLRATPGFWLNPQILQTIGLVPGCSRQTHSLGKEFGAQHKTQYSTASTEKPPPLSLVRAMTSVWFHGIGSLFPHFHRFPQKCMSWVPSRIKRRALNIFTVSRFLFLTHSLTKSLVPICR